MLKTNIKTIAPSASMLGRLSILAQEWMRCVYRMLSEADRPFQTQHSQ